MFYVFYVNLGKWMDQIVVDILTFSLLELKRSIADELDVRESSLMLFTKEGEFLKGDDLVATFGVGGPNSPVFVLNQADLELAKSPQSIIDKEAARLLEGLEEHFRMAIDMPPSLDALKKRLALVRNCLTHGNDVNSALLRMLQEHLMQQTGLEALCRSVQPLRESLEERLKDGFARRDALLSKSDEHSALLENFPDVLETLSQLSLPGGVHECLTASRRYLAGSCDSVTSAMGYSRGGVAAAAAAAPEGAAPISDPTVLPPSGASLLDWIHAQSPVHSLKDFCAECQVSLSKISADFPPGWAHCTEDFYKRLELVDQYARPGGLPEVIVKLRGASDKVRQLIREQEMYMESMHKQQQNFWANATDDAQLLKTLHESHKKQLEAMLSNHQEILQVFSDVSKSKVNMCVQMQTCYQFFVGLYRRVAEFDEIGKPALTFLNLLQQRLQLISAISHAPAHFATAVLESRRQNEWSQRYYACAERMSSSVSAVVQEEIALRQQFAREMGSHFVRTLFPGICSNLPVFVTPLSSSYKRPPAVSTDEVERLLSSYPPIQSSQWYQHYTEPKDPTSCIQPLDTGKHEMEEKAGREAEERALREAEGRALREALEQARRDELLKQVRRDAEQQQARLDVEKHAQCAAEEQARRRAAEQALQETDQERVQLDTRVHNLEAEIEEVRGKMDSMRKVQDIAVSKLTVKHQAESNELRQQWDDEKGLLLHELDHQHEAHQNEMKSLKETIECLSSDLASLETDRDQHYRRYLECERDMRALQRESTLLTTTTAAVTPGSAATSPTAVTPGKLSLADSQVAHCPSPTTRPSDTVSMTSSGGSDAVGPCAAEAAKVLEENEDPLQKPKQKVSVKNLAKGDLVLFFHHADHNQYKAVVEGSKTLHFLHENCHAELGINLKAEPPIEPTSVIGRLVDKERCETKKDNNRFKLPVGTRFNRLVAIPP
eukprot:scpid25986/ scgid9967/ RB1-inducible coiled-coil protein 1; FAK family kinase-interacting protein of 200 kDa